MAQIKDPMTDADGRTSQEIREDIRRTRAQMDCTVEAIEGKLSPGELLHEAWTLLRGGSSTSVSRVWRIAKDYPLPAAVISLGLGWMMYESRGGSEARSAPEQRRRAQYTEAGYWPHTPEGYWPPESGERGTFETARQKAASVGRRVSAAAESAVGTAGNMAEQARERAAEAAGQAREMASEAAGSVRQQASELGRQASVLGDQTRQTIRQARTGLWRTLDEQPLLVGAATLAAGLLVGLLMPSTRRESELMGEARDSLVDQVKETMEKGKQVAAAAAESLKQGAEAQGLSAESVAEKVRSVGREVMETVKSEAQKQSLGPETISPEPPPRHRAA
jgi:Protein of unknown function (DUF3618)